MHVSLLANLALAETLAPVGYRPLPALAVGPPLVLASVGGLPTLGYFPRAGAYRLVETRDGLRLSATLEARPEDAYVPRPGTYRLAVSRPPGSAPSLSVRPV